jgi:sorting nexin-1/2
LNQAERRSNDAKRDFEDVGKLVKAEMARFDKEKVEDFKKAVEDYADGMVLRQRSVNSIPHGSSLY